MQITTLLLYEIIQNNNSKSELDNVNTPSYFLNTKTVSEHIGLTILFDFPVILLYLYATKTCKFIITLKFT